jgi:hypothetical protein
VKENEAHSHAIDASVNNGFDTFTDEPKVTDVQKLIAAETEAPARK